MARPGWPWVLTSVPVYVCHPGATWELPPQEPRQHNFFPWSQSLCVIRCREYVSTWNLERILSLLVDSGGTHTSKPPGSGAEKPGGLSQCHMGMESGL